MAERKLAHAKDVLRRYLDATPADNDKYLIQVLGGYLANLHPDMVLTELRCLAEGRIELDIGLPDQDAISADRHVVHNDATSLRLTSSTFVRDERLVHLAVVAMLAFADILTVIGSQRRNVSFRAGSKDASDRILPVLRCRFETGEVMVHRNELIAAIKGRKPVRLPGVAIEMPMADGR
jgi:hypothetical protein